LASCTPARKQSKKGRREVSKDFPCRPRRGEGLPILSAPQEQTNKIEREYWLYTLNGVRVRTSTTDQEEAHRLARKKAEELERGHISSRTLTGTELESYLRVEKLLLAEGLSLEGAIRDYVAAYQLVKPVSLVQIARQHRENRARPINPKSIEIAMPEFLKSLSERSDRHQQTVRNDLARFATRFSGPMLDVNACEFDIWLHELVKTDRAGNPLRGAPLA